MVPMASFYEEQDTTKILLSSYRSSSSSNDVVDYELSTEKWLYRGIRSNMESCQAEYVHDKRPWPTSRS